MLSYEKRNMKIYHFAIAADWEYDLDFLKLLEKTAHKQGLSTYVVWPNNLSETIEQVKSGELLFRFFYDRASDTSPEFLTLHKLMLQKRVPIFDNWSVLEWAADKATMQHHFEEMKINTPFTIVIPPWREQPNIRLADHEFDKLGVPFVVKPANTTGGGIGVMKSARSMQDILNVRQMFPGERYLVQQKIYPREKDERRFWFRGIYTCGLIQVTWWNDLTYKYTTLTHEEIECYDLLPLFRQVYKIARACNLNFFSTEIAVDAAGELKVVDYVNEVCDMRLKSQVFDGVPDEIVERIAVRIVNHVKEKMLPFVYL